MTNLELAKQELNKVGSLLSKELSNPRVKKILLVLKNVNTELNAIINGDSDFSFDDLEESQIATKPRMRETKPAQNAYGVDLGGFENFISGGQEESFDWRATMREANGGADVNLDFDPNTAGNADSSIYGRLIDNT